MTDELKNLLNKYGLLPDSKYVVARPHLSKEERRYLGKIKKKYIRELTNAKQMRIDVLNLTRGVARPRIVEQLLADGHSEAAYLLTFNDEQIALLLTYKDYEQGKAGSSSLEDSKATPKRKQSTGKAKSSTV